MSMRLSRIFGLFSISLLVASCTAATPSGDQQSSSSSSAAMESSSSTSESSAAMEQKASVSSPSAMIEEDDDADNVTVDVDAGMTASSRIITVDVANFAFTPNVIAVKKGEKVTLRLTGKQGMHGFAIADLGINATISEGKTVDVDLPTATAGTFSFRCSIPCGPGHKEMTGVLTVR